ncbi:MAG: HEPN domain-containing protein [Gemmataceae bacterium]
MKRMTREWVRKAEDDFRLASLVAGQSGQFHDQICFHCQQSAEKYLKAVLEERGQAVPRTHSLDELLTQLLPYYPALGRHRRGLRFLTGFAVDPRYPLLRTTKRQARSALRWAGRVRDECRGLLRLR